MAPTQELAANKTIKVPTMVLFEKKGVVCMHFITGSGMKFLIYVNIYLLLKGNTNTVVEHRWVDNDEIKKCDFFKSE